MVYGYARISTKCQNIKRQINNLESYCVPESNIFQEAFTGKKLDGRVKFNNLLKLVKSGDTIVFDSVSRMSRNSEDGCTTYFNLVNKGINLVFLKEPHINSEVYGDNITQASTIKVNDKDLDATIMNGVREYMVSLAKKQIEIAFNQSEKEAADIVQRVTEGIANKKANDEYTGGAPRGNAHNKKEIPVDTIKKYSNSFNGNLNKVQLANMLKVSRPTVDKWIKNLKELEA